MTKEELPYYIKKEGESDQEHWKRMQTYLVGEDKRKEAERIYKENWSSGRTGPFSGILDFLDIDNPHRLHTAEEGLFDTTGEMLASKLIGQDPVTGEISQHKDNNMSNGNAHENIDNQILIDSIKRIKHASHGNWMEGLFEAQTKGGDTRNIYRSQARYPSKDAWVDMQSNLMRNVKNNPNFSDTLRQEEMPGTIEGMQNTASGNTMIGNLLRLLMKKITN